MTIPADLLIRNQEPKHLLKRYAQSLIPREVIYRPKWGFGIPVGHWFSATWAQALRRILLSNQAKSRGWFRPELIDQVLEDHIAGRANHNHRIWTLLVFEIWNRLFIDRSMSPGDPSYDEPYFYVTPWPAGETAELPPVEGNGIWHREGWIGAVLPASRLTSDAGSEQGRQVYAFLCSAMAAARAHLGTL